MASGFLQAKNIGNIIKGGYTRGCPPNYQHVPTNPLLPNLPDDCEWTRLDGDPQYEDWATVKDDTKEHTSTTTYYYSDSVSASNRLSSQVKVVVKTVWKVVKYTDTNDIILDVKGYLIEAERYNVNPGTRPGTFYIRASGYWNDGENVIAKRNYYPSSTGKKTNAAETSRIFPKGELLLTDYRVKLAPSKTTEEWPSVLYENAYNGDWSNRSGVSLDIIAIGMMFRNNLPADLPTPTIANETQADQICTSSVTVTHAFSPILVNGSRLRVWWRYAGEEWSDTRRAEVDVTRNVATTVEVPNLISDTMVYWRAQYIPYGDNGLHSSDVFEWSSKTRWIPSVDMTVPDITIVDCTAIKSGKYLEPFTKPTCYNETACVTAKIPANYCDTMEQEIKDYDDPGCRDRGDNNG